jgi:hypothetical protein
VIQESRIVVASDSDRGDFMNSVNLVVKMPRADCGRGLILGRLELRKGRSDTLVLGL